MIFQGQAGNEVLETLSWLAKAGHPVTPAS